MTYPIRTHIPKRGRPPMYDGAKMVQTAVWMPSEMIDWLKAQPGTISHVIRKLVQAAMSQK